MILYFAKMLPFAKSENKNIAKIARSGTMCWFSNRVEGQNKTTVKEVINLRTENTMAK